MLQASTLPTLLWMTFRCISDLLSVSGVTVAHVPVADFAPQGSGDTSGDFTQAATLFPGNGTWITPESGPS